MAKAPKAKPAKKTSQPPPRTQVPDHLPALNALELEAFQQRLMAESGVSEAGKRMILQSLRAAANPQAESPDVVIKTLEKEEQKNVVEAQAGYAHALNAPLARGRARLMGMSDAEWEELLSDK